MSDQTQHISVLLKESVDGLDIKADGIYVDGTFGRGGHSSVILSQLNDHGRLYAIDRDLHAIEEAKKIRRRSAFSYQPQRIFPIRNCCRGSWHQRQGRWSTVGSWCFIAAIG